jgi:hypothetical protein
MVTDKTLPAVVIGIIALLSVSVVQAADEFASPAFAQRWRHDEQIVPNFWGPLATAHPGQYEQYLGVATCPHAIACHVVPVEPTAERRLVQYFDKGRMELTIAAGGPTVTAGLLVREMITGRVQISDTQFVDQSPAAVPVAGDADNPFPFYRDLSGGATMAPTASVGAPVQLLLTPTGASTTTAFATDPQTIGAERDGQTGHALPRAFADFRTRVGLETVGLAVTEPFWADVKIAGTVRRVMIQAFERRVLTYNPANPAAFQVEFGNVGQQYYAWRAIAEV